jgi:hypothetical protein
MSICSMHQQHDPSCDLCNTDIKDVLPNYDEMLAKAEEAGLTTCVNCDFEFYKTTEICPKCSHKWED